MGTYAETPQQDLDTHQLVTFGSCMAKGRLIKCKMKPYQRPPDQGCGAEARASSVHCGQDRGGVCNLSLTQAGDRLHSVSLKPGVPPPQKSIDAFVQYAPEVLNFDHSELSLHEASSQEITPITNQSASSSENCAFNQSPPVVWATIFNERGKRCSGDNITSNY